MKPSLALACYLAVLFVTPAYAFRSTDFESFTDPEFVGYRPSAIVVVVLTDNFELTRELESRLIDELAEFGIEAVGALAMFPPTRPLESYDVFGALAAKRIDSALVVTAGNRTSDVAVFGSNTTTNVNAYGNNVTANSTTTPMIFARSRAQFTASLLSVGQDAATTKTAWLAQVLVKASGTLFAGNEKGDAKGAVRGIVRGLKEDGHLSE